MNFHIIIGAAIEVYKTLGGFGLLESIYEAAICHEFETQLLTYLRLAGIKLGLFVNFWNSQVKNGITRVVNGL